MKKVKKVKGFYTIYKSCFTFFTFFISLINVSSMAFATPAEDAIAQLWGAHRNAPNDHESMVARCNDAMRRRSGDAPLLGNFQPVAQTLLGWHLLRQGKTNEAVRTFEGVLTPNPSPDHVARTADLMARRWLTRIDHAKVVGALRVYYAANVAYPPSLDYFNSVPEHERPPMRDRFGEAWYFKETTFSRIKTAAGQRYDLYSSSIGKELTDFSKIGKRYPLPAMTMVRKGGGMPITLEFTNPSTPDAAPVALAVGGVSPTGLRFVALDSAGRFALLSDSDFWFIAMPKGK